MYQYCSSDVHDVVQRHLRVSHSDPLIVQMPAHHSLSQYEGEKDTRGPADFSGNAASKLDENGEGDDDDVDDEDQDVVPSRAGAGKRRSDGKLKSSGSDLPMAADVRLKFTPCCRA